MLRLHHCAILAAGLALAACTRPPLAAKDTQPVETATSVRDWDKVASRITAELGQRGMLIAPKPGATPAAPPWGPYYVHVRTPRSTFLQAVAESLRTQIANAGGTLARSPAGAVVINLHVDHVKHAPPEQLAGSEFTAIGTAIAAVEVARVGAAVANPWVAAAVTGGAAIAGGMMVDGYLSQYPSMTGEVMWRATVVSPQQELMRVGGPFYVAASELPLYAGEVTLAEMTTPGVALAPPVRRMRYTGGHAPAAAPAAPACPAQCVPAPPATR